MKRIVLLLLMVIAVSGVKAQYKPVDKGSTLGFVIQNVGFDVKGSFTGFQGTINFDTQNPAKSSFDVSIDAATVNTDNSLRDEHLKGESYFDVKNYPRIRLVSDKVTQSGKGAYTLSGKLTIKNKSQNITFPFTATPAGDDINFKGTFSINRKDFDVGGTSTISNELKVMLNVTAKK